MEKLNLIDRFLELCLLYYKLQYNFYYNIVSLEEFALEFEKRVLKTEQKNTEQNE